MRYLGGAPLDQPLPEDPGMIFFLFFSLSLAQAFIDPSLLMAVLASLLYDRLGNIFRRSCIWTVSPLRKRLTFFSSVSTWWDPYWARVLN
jgi:predicted neutral ceramidase superfamily lipid hydrolase